VDLLFTADNNDHPLGIMTLIYSVAIKKKKLNKITFFLDLTLLSS